MRRDVETSAGQPSEMRATIERLHRVYCELAGYELPLTYGRERDWYEWLRWRAGHGARFDENDLKLVVQYLRRSRGAEADQAVRFSELISRPDVFEEHLMIAQSRAREAPGRARVRRTEEVVRLRDALAGALDMLAERLRSGGNGGNHEH